MTQAGQAGIGGILWYRVRNLESEAVPPFGVMRIAGTDADGTVTVGKAIVDGEVDVLVNGAVTIPPGPATTTTTTAAPGTTTSTTTTTPDPKGGNYGQAYRPQYASILYDPSAGTPEVDSVWGVAAGTWWLRPDLPGFLAKGNAQDGVGSFLVDPVQATTTTTTTTTCGPCAGACLFAWMPATNTWHLVSSSCSGSCGCQCCPPQRCGTLSCEIALGTCGTAGSGCLVPICTFGGGGGGGGGGGSGVPSCDSVCLWKYSTADLKWYLIGNGCAGTCACSSPPDISSPVDCQTGTVACAPCPVTSTTTTTGTDTTTTSTSTTSTTTTTMAPCGDCAWNWDGTQWTLAGSGGCTGGCGCFAPTFQGGCQGVQALTPCGTTTSTSTTTTTICPTTTTAPPSCGTCTYACGPGYGSLDFWALYFVGCTDGCTCSGPPELSPYCAGCVGAVNQVQSTNCSGPTTTTTTTSSTTTTTTTGPPTCGICQWVWNGSIWNLDTNSCTGGCSCVTPGFSGALIDENTSTNCAIGGGTTTSTTTTSGPTTTTTTLAPCGGNCYYQWLGASWVLYDNVCDGGCLCQGPPSSPGATYGQVFGTYCV